MHNNNPLINSGMEFIGDKNCLSTKQKTLIVLGVARGGTSLLSGSLHNLNIFTGDLSVKPVFEDAKLAKAFESKDDKLVDEILEMYNSQHDVWGFKRPSMISYIDEIHHKFRNPIYLIVFKDIFSISVRQKISMNLNVVDQLKNTLNNYNKIIEFINSSNPNAFLFSFDKILKNKEAFIDSLIHASGQKTDSENKQAALNFISPNPEEYLDITRISKSVGQIGEASEFRVVGWGKYKYSDEAATVELYINDKLIESKIANDFRQHTFDSGIHPSGHCGYFFDLTKKPLENGDKVSVKLSKDVNCLKHSNQIFKKQ